MKGYWIFFTGVMSVIFFELFNILSGNGPDSAEPIWYFLAFIVGVNIRTFIFILEEL